MKLTKKITDVKLIETDHGYAVEMDLSPEEMRVIYEEQRHYFVSEDINAQLERMVYDERITQDQMDAFLANEASMKEVIEETIDADTPDTYWCGIEFEILKRIKY